MKNPYLRIKDEVFIKNQAYKMPLNFLSPFLFITPKLPANLSNIIHL
ncbi:hypothetical protein HFN_1872 [Helicobacter fennelliae MRY12-0050]|uniref:Uncharacterized protein n=1 Tax=Helicobacter fennelliae MRY12-0050 TaxID=1325130 RepID=T1CNA6_9HELI|nr:hypothetical protein HFN_1872 [Helicobacter fennelliae MRY12-0050]